MNISLGIHVGHDRSVAIIKDGVVIGAIAQERVDRIKHSNSYTLPYESIDRLLKYLNLNFEDISCIGLSYNSIEDLSVENFYDEEIKDHYNCSSIPIFFTNHHIAHCYSAYYSSGFNNALVFVADGAGDYLNNAQEAESLFVCNNSKIELVTKRLQNPTIGKMTDSRNYIIPHMPSFIQNQEISLGKKYTQITHLLGLGLNGEGKTMGLSGYGTPLFNYNPYHKGDFLDFSLKYKDIILEVFSMANLSSLSYKEFMKKESANIASTLQLMLENVILDLLTDVLNMYKNKNIVLSGGIFLNCLLNYKIISKFDLDNFFVLPPAGDDGQALGAAYYAYNKYFGKQNKFEISLPYIGLSYKRYEIENALNYTNLSYKEFSDDNLAIEVAKRVSDSKVIAIHRGRTEIGPRALCHRSILANPCNPNTKNILNNKVKHRESFRPFAPVVVAEEQFEYFDIPFKSEYMTIATMVKEKYRDQLPGITHIDGTSRVQAISFDSDPFIYKVLLEVEKLIGFPILVNTSFNVNGEPIVESPYDAIETFLKTEIDTLVINNFIIDK